MLERAKALTRESEGFRDKAYKDPGGIWTIGYGQTGSFVKPGLTCTHEQAERWLDENYNIIIKQVQSVVEVELTEGQLGALCDFVYNLGIGNLKSSTLLAMLNMGDYDGAYDQFSRWVYQNKVRLDGLVIRRKREQQLWKTGDWS